MPRMAISKSNSRRFGIDKFPENQKRMWSGYLATVTYMDEQVGRILDALKKLGLDKETAIFFTSDHGYLLGEHNFWQKGNLREEVTRVPLIIKKPDEKPGISKSLVELVDIFPTACEIVGIQIPESVQGKSLIPILKDPDSIVKETAFSFIQNGASMRYKKWAYMKYKDGTEELYDMHKDPKQFTNLASFEKNSKLMEILRSKFKIETKLH